MPTIGFSQIGFQEYQPHPEDLCSLCGANVGKEAMVEAKNNIHICMGCVDLLSEIKKEREKKKKERAITSLRNAICGEVPDTGMATAEMYATRAYEAIAAGNIPGIRIE